MIDITWKSVTREELDKLSKQAAHIEYFRFHDRAIEFIGAFNLLADDKNKSLSFFSFKVTLLHSGVIAYKDSDPFDAQSCVLLTREQLDIILEKYASVYDFREHCSTPHLLSSSPSR